MNNIQLLKESARLPQRVIHSYLLVRVYSQDARSAAVLLQGTVERL